MVGRVIQVQGFLATDHLADQALTEIQANLPDNVRVIAVGSHHDILAGVIIDQIYRADIDRHRLLDARDNHFQCAGQVRGAVYFLDNPSQGVEQNSDSG